MTNQAKKKIDWEERELTIKEALAWSDRHRKLSDNEGVRVIHIQQLLKRFASSQLSDLRREIEGLRDKESDDNFRGDAVTECDEAGGYHQALDDILKLLDKKARKK